MDRINIILGTWRSIVEINISLAIQVIGVVDSSEALDSRNGFHFVKAVFVGFSGREILNPVIVFQSSFLVKTDHGVRHGLQTFGIKHRSTNRRHKFHLQQDRKA